MALNYETLYGMYHQVPLLSRQQRTCLDTALEERLPFAEAFKRFTGALCLYTLFKVHVTCRPTLKRLAALRLLELENQRLFCFQRGQMPETLYHEVMQFDRYTWTLKVFHSICNSFDFFPPLHVPEDAVGKEMVLNATKRGVVWSFQSVTPGWRVKMDLYSFFTIFKLIRRDVKKIKILFLEVVHGSLDEYVFDFHHVDEELDFSKF